MEILIPYYYILPLNSSSLALVLTMLELSADPTSKFKRLNHIEIK